MVKGLCEKDFLRKPFTILIGSLYLIQIIANPGLNSMGKQFLFKELWSS